MKRFYVVVFLIIGNYQAFAQIIKNDVAGPDKTVSDKSAKIGTAENKQWCYHWEANPADPSLTEISSAQPTVKPSQTTKYTLTVTGPDFSFKKKYEVTVFKFGIEYFRYTAGKEWKVVLGEPIEYSAIASADCKDWNWKMGSDDIWHLVDFKKDKNKGEMKISTEFFSKIVFKENSMFGDTNGEITVTCTDGEGIKHTFSTTEINPQKKVMVFFDPLKNKAGIADVSDTYPPAWFFYWKEGEVVEDMKLCTFVLQPKYQNSSGYWEESTKKMVLCPLAISQHQQISLKDLNGKPFNVGGRGVHLQAVGELIAHELHHRDINKISGGPGPVKPGHMDTDGISDDEENSPSEKFLPRSLPDNPDSFGLKYQKTESGIDYSDNEVRCLIIEIFKPKTTHPEKDWSKSDHNPKWKF